jgi:hypothetical protein
MVIFKGAVEGMRWGLMKLEGREHFKRGFL